jgi:PhoH-like ATPase
LVKNYILDTNVLIHDPNCIFKFEDNNLIIPFPVIEEIDKLKTRSDKVAKSARDVARILDSLRDGMPLQKGVKLQNGGTLKILAIEKNDPKYKMPSYLGESKDNFILYYALYLKEVDKNFKTIIVSKDLNLRIKADALGIESQDYLSDKIDIELLPDGYIIIDNPTKHLEIKDTYTYSELGLNEEPYPNTYLKYGEKLLRYNKKKQAFEKIQMTFNSVIFGITPRSAEQVFAFYKKSKKVYFVIFLIVFSLLPFLTEWFQSFTYYHTYSKFDMLASYSGAVVGFLFFFFKYKAFSEE